MFSERRFVKVLVNLQQLLVLDDVRLLGYLFLFFFQMVATAHVFAVLPHLIAIFIVI